MTESRPDPCPPEDELRSLRSEVRRLQGELDQDREHLRAMVRDAPVVLYRLDREGIFRLSEGQGRAVLGWESGDIVGRPFEEVFRDRPELLEHQRRARLGESFVVPVTAGGHVFEVYHVPVHDAAGSYDGTVGVAVDVTQRFRANEALRRANRRLRMLSDCNQALIRATDERELLGTLCSIAVRVGGYLMAWVGYAEADADKSVVPVASAGDDDGYVRDARVSWGETERGMGPVGRAIRSGTPCAVQNVLDDERFRPWRELAIRRGYGSVCALPLVVEGRTMGAFVLYSAAADAFASDEVALLSELAGDLAFGIGNLRVRAEQRQAAAAVRANEERFRRLVEHSNDIISVTDERGVQTYLSGPVERLLGYRPEELVGGSGLSLLHPEDLELARQVFRDVLDHPGLVRTSEFRCRHREGRWVEMEAVGTRLAGDGDLREVVLNVRDVSERRAAERERARLQDQLQQAMKMEAVGRLAGGVAHDFNNLLTVILGNLEMARLELSGGEPLLSYLNEVQRSAESAASLTRQLLAFSRHQITEPRVLNINHLVADLHKMLKRLIGEDIELSLGLAPELGAVKVDPGHFEQVLVNLAVNARDAMPQGGRLALETANIDLDDAYCAKHPQTSPGPFVLLAVSDTGVGMPEWVKQRLFEPFFTTKPTGRGTGLGLSTLFGIVKQAGGSIEVYSEPGRGTTFKVYLPRVATAALRAPAPGPLAAVPRGSETILVVEDEACVREVALGMLRRLGYVVLDATCGPEALALAELRRGPIDLLLTDVVMPGMNGRVLAERLLRLHPETRVLYTSGYTENVIVHHGVLDRDVEFVGKPFNLQTLAAKVREVLDRPGPAETPPV